MARPPVGNIARSAQARESEMVEDHVGIKTLLGGRLLEGVDRLLLPVPPSPLGRSARGGFVMVIGAVPDLSRSLNYSERHLTSFTVNDTVVRRRDPEDGLAVVRAASQ